MCRREEILKKEKERLKRNKGRMEKPFSGVMISPRMSNDEVVSTIHYCVSFMYVLFDTGQLNLTQSSFIQNSDKEYEWEEEEQRLREGRQTIDGKQRREDRQKKKDIERTLYLEPKLR